MRFISTLRLGAIAGLMACASAQVNADWDRTARFAEYRTYAWMDTPRMQELQQGTLFDRRLRSAVESELASKGLRKSDASGEADVLLAYHAGVKDKLDVQQWGHFGRRWDVREYQQGTLVIDVVDASSESLVWRASATEEVRTSDVSDAKIAEVVQKMFASFPTT